MKRLASSQKAMVVAPTQDECEEKKRKAKRKGIKNGGKEKKGCKTELAARSTELPLRARDLQNF